MSIDITLNTAEQKLAKFLAAARTGNARKKNIPDGKVGGQSGQATDLEGVGGEIAYCKHMNIYPDTEIDLDVLPIGDAYSLRHGVVDVKTTKYRNGHLLAVKGKSTKELPDTYALMIGTFPTYRFVGWVPAEDLIQKTNYKDFGRGVGYALSQENLISPDAPTSTEGPL